MCSTRGVVSLMLSVVNQITALLVFQLISDYPRSTGINEVFSQAQAGTTLGCGISMHGHSRLSQARDSAWPEGTLIGS